MEKSLQNVAEKVVRYSLFDDIFGGNAQKRGKIRWGGGSPKRAKKS